MVRLILVATPAVCLIGAVAVSATLKNLAKLLREKKPTVVTSAKTSGSTKAAAKVCVPIILSSLDFVQLQH